MILYVLYICLIIGFYAIRRAIFINGHEFEQALGVGDGQGGLAGCDSWGHKELDMTE